MILATQRPSVDVISGLIKANVRFHVSLLRCHLGPTRTVLGQWSGEIAWSWRHALLNRLMKIINPFTRILCLSCQFVKEQAEADYDDAFDQGKYRVRL